MNLKVSPLILAGAISTSKEILSSDARKNASAVGGQVLDSVDCVPMRGLPGSMSFHLLVVLAILIERRLYSSLQPALVVVVESDELEGLKTPGDRRQHFGGAQHRPATGQEHQLDLQAQIEGLGQAEQAASNRDDFQLAGYAMTILTSKDGRSCFRKTGSGGAR